MHENENKNEYMEKGNFYASPVFDKIDFVLCCNSKWILDIFKLFWLFLKYSQTFLVSILSYIDTI